MAEPRLAPIPPIGSPAFYQDPFPTYRALLDDGARTLRLTPTIVAVTHYRDCLDLHRDSRLSARRYNRNLAHYTPEQVQAIPNWVTVAGDMLIFMDDPRHTRVRKLLLSAFSPESVSRLVPRMEAIFHELLAAVPAGVEVDFMAALAHRFPALVIGEILGVPRSGWEQLMRWSDLMAEFIATFQAPFSLALATEQATSDMLDYFRELFALKRREPADDLITAMLRVEEDGDVLSTPELLAQCVLLLVAGHETTRNLLGNGMSLLLRHPDQLQRLRADPALTRSAIEEFLRFEGPLQGTSRTALQDLDYLGESIRAGDSLLSLVGCANRDPQQFPDPHRLDIARKNNSHLTFGAGAHTCLGLHLARIEAQIAFPALLERFPVIELRETTLAWSQTLTLRGLKRLNVLMQ
jgi:pimeloyl-[acyl-carrier protein] synthase